MTPSSLQDFLSNGGRIHFVGCAGAGTLPLLKIFRELGCSVSGSDLLSPEKLNPLRAAGVPLFTGHSAANLPPENGAPLLLVHTSAAAPDNPEIAEARRRGCRILKRGELLAALAGSYRRTAAICGSHGKTSVTAMLAFLLSGAGKDPGFLIGGSPAGGNFPGGSAGAGRDIFVTEADESDGTNTLIHSELGIVPNAGDDHAWSVGGAEKLDANFRTFAFQAKTLLYLASPRTDSLFAGHPCAIRIDPAQEEYRAVLADLRTESAHPWGGWQRKDALLALLAAEHFGVDRSEGTGILTRFPGVERRMSVRFENTSYTLIEDYAHHPSELRATLDALRETGGERRLVLFFQPHRYARLERYFAEFASALKLADRVFVLPVFSAWTGKGKYDSSDLAAAAGPEASALSGTWENIAQQAVPDLRKGDLIAICGAGDSNALIPPLIRALSGEKD